MSINIFGDLQHETVEILAEKVAGYPFNTLGSRNNKATLNGSDKLISQNLLNYCLDIESQMHEIENDERIILLKKCLEKLKLLDKQKNDCKNVSYIYFLF